MTPKILLLSFLMLSLTASAQPLTSTNSWDFICENYALTGIATVQISKSEKGGILKISVETTNPAFVISGTAYVFLADNSAITCSDKNQREVSGNRITTYYRFSPAEMNKLKNIEIQSIHFNIKGNSKGFSSQIGNFTAVNKKSYFATTFDKTKKSHDTAGEISALYN